MTAVWFKQQGFMQCFCEWHGVRSLVLCQLMHQHWADFLAFRLPEVDEKKARNLVQNPSCKSTVAHGKKCSQSVNVDGAGWKFVLQDRPAEGAGAENCVQESVRIWSICRLPHIWGSVRILKRCVAIPVLSLLVKEYVRTNLEWTFWECWTSSGSPKICVASAPAVYSSSHNICVKATFINYEGD